MQNTIAGVMLAATLTGVGALLSEGVSQGQHMAKIDTVLENQATMMKELKASESGVSPLIDARLNELRERLNLHEQRLNTIESKQR